MNSEEAALSELTSMFMEAGTTGPEIAGTTGPEIAEAMEREAKRLREEAE